jgi:hypothetical protein
MKGRGVTNIKIALWGRVFLFLLLYYRGWATTFLLTNQMDSSAPSLKKK